jgi:hypothetical protein
MKIYEKYHTFAAIIIILNLNAYGKSKKKIKVYT